MSGLHAALADGPAGPPSKSWSVMRRLTPMRLTLGLWAIAAGLDLSISFLGGGLPGTPVRVACTYGCGAALALLADPSVGRVKDHRSFSFLRIVLVAIPSGTLLFVIDVLGRAIAHGHPPWREWPTDFFLRLRPCWAYFMMLFVFQSAVTWLASAAKDLEHRDRRLLKARLAALRLQINPHFLFNTLAAVSTLVSDGRAPEAEMMIARLSDFLRTSLSIEPAVFVPLAAEIDMAQAYLDIEAARFGGRLRVDYAIERELSDLLVPSLILQPLIENVVKHAVGACSRPVIVSISAAKMDEGRLALVVADDGDGEPARGGQGTGIGQANVAARLEALYEGRARLDAVRNETGYTVTLQLPLITESEASEREASEPPPSRIDPESGVRSPGRGRSRHRRNADLETP